MDKRRMRNMARQTFSAGGLWHRFLDLQAGLYLHKIALREGGS